MRFWHSTTFSNLINAEGEHISMKKNLCQNVANKILGKVRKFQDHIYQDHHSIKSYSKMFKWVDHLVPPS